MLRGSSVPAESWKTEYASPYSLEMWCGAIVVGIFLYVKAILSQSSPCLPGQALPVVTRELRFCPSFCDGSNDPCTP